jgi:phage gpG-like protein
VSKFQLAKKAAKFKAEVPRLLDKMANNAVYQFKVVNFDAHGFVDGSVRAWTPNKVSSGHQQLVGTGRMRESIRVLGKSFNSRLVGSDVPYAPYHNSGTERLPQRKFVGNSKQLEQKNGKLLMTVIKSIV